MLLLSRQQGRAKRESLGSLDLRKLTLAEFGRIEKTLHTLNYINDEDKRKAILVQLNRGESRHSLARNVFHGRRGELRQRYREGVETAR
jgi:TnpA family transposase